MYFLRFSSVYFLNFIAGISYLLYYVVKGPKISFEIFDLFLVLAQSFSYRLHLLMRIYRPLFFLSNCILLFFSLQYHFINLMQAIDMVVWILGHLYRDLLWKSPSEYIPRGYLVVRIRPDSFEYFKKHFLLIPLQMIQLKMLFQRQNIGSRFKLGQNKSSPRLLLPPLFETR